MVQKEICCFFWCQNLPPALSAWDEPLFVNPHGLWSLVPLENLMFGFGPVSPSESHKRWFPQVFFPSKKLETRCLCRCLRNQCSWTPSAISPFFWAQLEDSEDFFLGFATLKKPWLWRIEVPTMAMVTCRYDADIKLLVDLGILGRDSSFFCITMWHLVQVQKSKKCRKVQPQIKVHAHDRQKRDVQNLHIS